jgi:hypothetical protein
MARRCDALEIAGRKARPTVADTDAGVGPGTLHGEGDRLARCELERVLEQVDEDALELRSVNRDDRNLGGHRHDDTLGIRKVGQGMLDERIERPQLSGR